MTQIKIDPPHIKEARRPREITFYGGPNDGKTEFVKELFVANQPLFPKGGGKVTEYQYPKEDEIIESWTWIEPPFLLTRNWEPKQKNYRPMACYTVVGDYAYFEGLVNWGDGDNDNNNNNDDDKNPNSDGAGLKITQKIE
jgi:hypothetical protein